MLRFLKRIGRRLGLVKLASGGEIHVHSTLAIDRDALRKWMEREVRRASIVSQCRDRFPREQGSILKPSLQFEFHPDEINGPGDLLLRIAAEQFAAAVIDALQNG